MLRFNTDEIFKRCIEISKLHLPYMITFEETITGTSNTQLMILFSWKYEKQRYELTSSYHTMV
jgi:hypothetical protein